MELMSLKIILNKMVIGRIIFGINKLYSPSCMLGNNASLTSCPCKTRTFSTSLDKYTKDSATFKERLISSLNFKATEDAAPFYKLDHKVLVQLSKITDNDRKNGYCDNRLYYIASQLKCPPAQLSEKLALRIFVYQLSFDWMKSSLDVLIKLGVPTNRIIRDLWVLKYHHATITERLQKIQDMGIENLYPWMVRCTPNILNKYISLCQETKNILGECESTEMYLAKRLNTSIDVVEEMYVKLPALRSIRVTKIKAFLDFLINEGFTVEDIVNKPRILAASQKTIQQRLEKLQALGLTSINLNILCRSRKDFKKYLESVESIMQDNDKVKKKDQSA